MIPNNYECEGQISINDYQIVVQNNGYANFHEHCNHRGWLKGATETEPAMYMCSYANRQNAKCWADWIPCKEQNCPLIRND